MRVTTTSDSRQIVSYDVYVPRHMDLDLRAHNGGLRVDGVTGRMTLETENGGVSLEGAGGDVRAHAQNGGLNVRLTGTHWEGAGLDAETQNGGVRLVVPEGYSARLETGTVNGGDPHGHPDHGERPHLAADLPHARLRRCTGAGDDDEWRRDHRARLGRRGARMGRR